MATQTLTPLQQIQQHMLSLRLNSLGLAQPAIGLQRLDVPPPDATPNIVVTTPYSNYPAPGAAAIVILSETVPAGFNEVFNLIAVFASQGGVVNGSGNVIWRVLIDGASVQGMDNLQSQLGSDAQPIPTYIHLIELSTIQITVEVPAGQPALPGTTGARLHGYRYPVNRTIGGMQ